MKRRFSMKSRKKCKRHLWETKFAKSRLNKTVFPIRFFNTIEKNFPFEKIVKCYKKCVFCDKEKNVGLSLVHNGAHEHLVYKSILLKFKIYDSTENKLIKVKDLKRIYYDKKK